jgi:hypothetical protein
MTAAIAKTANKTKPRAVRAIRRRGPIGGRDLITGRRVSISSAVWVTHSSVT